MSICYTIGCHPHFAPALLEVGALELLERLLLEGKGRGCVAVGECGMDGSSGCRVQKEVQAQAFRLQAKLAMKLQLPLVLHIREAEEDGLAVLKEVGLPRDWPVHRWGALEFRIAVIIYSGTAGMILGSWQINGFRNSQEVFLGSPTWSVTTTGWGSRRARS